MTTNTQRYDRISILLHWAVGLGIILLAGTELLRHEFPKGHFIREGLKPIHQPVGTVLFGLIILRIFWRMTMARVPAPQHGSAASHLAAHAMHMALYALMVAIPLTGLLSVLGNDRGVDFGLFQLMLPLKAQIGALAKSLREMHEAIAIGILGLVFLHAAAALAHHYVLSDGVLARMRLVGVRAPAALPE